MSLKIRRLATFPALALSAVIATTALAPAAAASPEQAAQTTREAPASSLVLSSSNPELAGYTYADAMLFAAKSEPGAVAVHSAPKQSGQVSTQGVDWNGWYVTVDMSQSQARAVLSGNAAAAAGIIGLAAGPFAGVVAAGVYGYLTSLGSDALNRCDRWAFDITINPVTRSALILRSYCA